MTSSDGTNAYAAAEGREFLAGELEGKDPKYVREFAGFELLDEGDGLEPEPELRNDGGKPK